MNLYLSEQHTAAYLRTLPAIREQCLHVFRLAEHGKLQYFDYHPEKEQDVAAFCIQIITVSVNNRTWPKLVYPIFSEILDPIFRR